MKIRWNEMTTADKAILIIRIIASVGVVVFVTLQLFGVCDQAINIAAPLIGLVLLIQSIQEWRLHRGVAVFGLCSALFIFTCTVVVWLLK